MIATQSTVTGFLSVALAPRNQHDARALDLFSSQLCKRVVTSSPFHLIPEIDRVDETVFQSHRPNSGQFHTPINNKLLHIKVRTIYNQFNTHSEVIFRSVRRLAKSKYYLRHVCLSVRLSAWNNAAP
jgi:hypothetical protein